MRARIALLPGDGIGPEVIAAAANVLDVVARQFGHTFALERHPIGGVALRNGEPPLPDTTRDACLAADAVLLGAVGDPEFDQAPGDRRPETALLQLRQELGVFANLRPAKVWPGLEGGSSLRSDVIKDLDLLIVRELTGGLYYGEPRGRTENPDAAFNTMRYSRPEIERIARVAFESARTRGKRVTSVDKANVLEVSRFWREVVIEVGADYPDVALDHQLVAGNLFGDILSDEAGAVVGSLGLLPSASIGGRGGLFEPVHGSAPDIAGQDIANPVAAIASAAMLLRHALGLETEARAIDDAIGRTLGDGIRTVDLGAPENPVSCSQMTEAVIERLNPHRTQKAAGA
jgi:3-isopropylmalate dehydrogenase